MTRKLKLPVFRFILANDGFTSISQFTGANVAGVFSSWRDSMAIFPGFAEENKRALEKL
jgi:hypothetical protein